MTAKQVMMFFFSSFLLLLLLLRLLFFVSFGKFFAELPERLYDRCGMCEIAHVNKNWYKIKNGFFMEGGGGGSIGFFFRVIITLVMREIDAT